MEGTPLPPPLVSTHDGTLPHSDPGTSSAPGSSTATPPTSSREPSLRDQIREVLRENPSLLASTGALSPSTGPDKFWTQLLFPLILESSAYTQLMYEIWQLMPCVYRCGIWGYAQQRPGGITRVALDWSHFSTSKEERCGSGRRRNKCKWCIQL